MSVVATTNAANGTWKAVRATTSHGGGKWYLEFTSGYIGDNGQIVGFGNSSLNTGSYVGSDGNSFGYQSQGDYLHVPAATGHWQSMAKMGEVVQIAVDINNKLVWARTDRSTNWNNSGTADPATGAGGLAFTTTGDLLPAFSGIDSTGANSASINAGGYPFVGSIPAGYAAWDAGTPTAALNTTTTTWDAATKNSNVTLSGGNLTASQSSATNTWCGVRSTTSASYGHVYYELTISAYDGGNGILAGVAGSTWAVGTNNQYVGVDTHSTGVQTSLSSVGWQYLAVHNSGQPGFQAFTSGQVMGFANDLNKGLAWVKNVSAAGDWNNDAFVDVPQRRLHRHVGSQYRRQRLHRHHADRLRRLG